MKSMRIEVQYSAETLTPLHRGLCDSPDLDREIILGGQSVDGVETISSFVYGTPEAYEELVAEQAAVLEYDITPDEDGFFVYLRQELGPDGQSMRDALAQDTVVVVPPIEFRSDGTMQTTVVGHSEDLKALTETVPAGLSISVLELGDSVVTPRAAISDRQQDALQVAWDLGYFDVPRRNGIEAVAAELDCAVSTASELLRRGAAHAIKQVLEPEG